MSIAPPRFSLRGYVPAAKGLRWDSARPPFSQRTGSRSFGNIFRFPDRPPTAVIFRRVSGNAADQSPRAVASQPGRGSKSSLDWESGFVFLDVGLSARDMAVRNI